MTFCNSFGVEIYEATTTLNVRSGPGTEHSVLFKLNPGDKVELVNQSDGNWYEVQYFNQKGYVSAKYLNYLETDTSAVESQSETAKNAFIALGIIAFILLIVIFSDRQKKQNSEATLQPQLQTINNQKVAVVITKSPKSTGIAILLTFIFGPLGLLYASVKGGLIMTFTPFLLVILLVYGGLADNPLLLISSIALLIFFGLTYWLICIIWAAVAVSHYNNSLQEQTI